jgi:hypothetical protein
MLSEGFAPPTGAIGHADSVRKWCRGDLEVSQPIETDNPSTRGGAARAFSALKGLVK